MLISAPPLAARPAPLPALIGTRERAREALLKHRNADGGWPYQPGKHSRLEPTCWALLALAEGGRLPLDLHPLRQWARAAGWLVDVSGTPINYAFNALAAFTLLQDTAATRLAEPIVSGVISAKGLAVPTTPASRQDSSLRAWSWVAGTFSWVEPTAWCMLLLKKWRGRSRLAAADERIGGGERMLIDRACRVGGWNYGNSNVFGQDLLPYVPTTALALLAMQDRRDHPIVAKALAHLQQDVLAERSPRALALSIICLAAFDVPAARIADDLLQMLARWDDSNRGGEMNIATLAMALYALSATSDSPQFRLQA